LQAVKSSIGDELRGIRYVYVAIHGVLRSIDVVF